ncbi:phage tail tape measure protein [Acinetobacter sp. B5B]|uniref:phage tail tape measure protein n=1 Tax=Acinetobacter baretiae TaxID=2605383 RepID=UPI0018C2DA5F|nr:phage tail tape measure protein [Acinetobacter baretiae]MBF7683908.1 phage tail tape measure protein [Acinetobacter baretiae]
MSKNTNLSVTLLVKGDAGKELKKITDQQVKDAQKINQQWTHIGTAQAKVVNTAKAGTQATISTARAGDQLLRTHRMLEGVLRQQSIQTKLQSQLLKQQENSAKHMASWMKQVEQSSQRTQKASKETSSLWQKGGAVAGGVAGGYMAAKAVAATPLERGRNFYKGIYEAGASITGGFKGMNTEQAKATRQELKDYAKDAVRTGHGTVEGVAEAANILAASGNYDKVSDLKTPLQAIAKSAFASGASEADMARLAGQAKQFGISPERTQVALDRMMQSGYSGGFELKDMAQFLPNILGLATKAGYGGETGLNTVTTHLQLARKYTGTPGEAATNVGDLYNLETQGHFKKAMGKYITPQAGDPTMAGKKGKRDFDFNQYLVNNQLKGIDTVTAMANLMNRQLSKNNKYNDLSKKLAQAISNKDTQAAENIKKAIEIVIAGSFGDVFHNQQSLSGMTAIVNGIKNGDYKKISDESLAGEGSVERVSKDKGGEEFAQYDALQQENILAQIKIYETVNSKLGNFEKGLTQIMQNNQALTAATIAATGALTVLASTAGGSILGSVLTDKKANGKAPATGGSGTTVATGNSKSSKIAKGAGAALMAPVAWDYGYSLGTAISEKYVEGTAFGDKLGSVIAHVLSPFNSDAKAAVEAQNRYDQMMIEEQRKGFDRMIQAFNNKPIFPNFPQTHFTGSLADRIANHQQQQEQRHGAPYALGK